MARAVTPNAPVVCFGEMLLRLSPPGARLMVQADTLEMNVGGAEANVAAALANAQNHFRIDRALGLSDEQDPAANWAAMARLWDDDPAQDGLRAAVYQAVQAQRIGFRHHNIEFGYVYREGALVPDGAPPYQPLDPIRLYEPMTRPGHPLPHAWIGQNGPQVALGDRVLIGHFLLIAAGKYHPISLW